LPDVTGTLLTTGGDGSSLTGITTGKVLQVVSVLTTTQASQTVSTSDTQVGLLTKSITPVGTNSNFLVVVRWFGEVDGSWSVTFNLQMDGTRVNDGGGGSGYGLAMPTINYGVTTENSSTPETVNFSTLVSSSSTVGTDIVFKVVVNAPSSYTLWNNRCFDTTSTSYERGTSEIIITEIGA
jgi:hypothetical protein